MAQTQAPHIKCVVVGGAGVGKTTLLVAATTGSCPHAENLPKSCDLHTYISKYDDAEIQLGLWDTPSHPDYERFRPLSYISAHVFLVLFACDDARSFEAVTAQWLPELRRHYPNTLWMLLMTKTDLLDRPPLEHVSDLCILSAHYGGKDLEHDVTAAARTWVNEHGGRGLEAGSCRDVFPDVRTGAGKRLRIVYASMSRHYAMPATHEQGELDLVISAPEGRVLHILTAHYGSAYQRDVTAAARAHVANTGEGRELRAAACNHVFGDPEEGVHKRVRIVYTHSKSMDGAPLDFGEIAIHEQLDGPISLVLGSPAAPTVAGRSVVSPTMARDLAEREGAAAFCAISSPRLDGVVGAMETAIGVGGGWLPPRLVSPRKPIQCEMM